MAREGSRRARGGDERAPGVAGRVPPHDLAAERSVLSALLLDARAFIDVAEEVRADDFYHPAHQTLYGAMVAIHEEQRPVDLVTLSDHLAGRKLLDAVGGPVFLAELADFEATAAHVVHHARIVRDKAVKRRLIQVATGVVESVFEEEGSSGELLDAAESKIFDISRSESRGSFRSLHDEMEPTFDYVEAIMSRAGSLTGIPTGYPDLDEMTGGLQNGELVILAARPSMGKTALALNMARNAAMDHQKKVAVFSLEMTTRALVLRLLSSEARVDFSIFRSKYVPTRDFTRLSQAGTRLAAAEIWIDDSGSLTILEIKAKCRRLKADKGLDLVILDYLQLAHADGRRERKDLEIAEISQGLKALAKELSIPVVALSQLNRGPEQRDPDKRRPNMGDLRESGAIEQDADLIAFIYRDHVYNKEADPHDAELIISKQRNGPTGTVHLHFEGRYARFETRAGAGFEGESAAAAPSVGFVGPGPGAGFAPGGAGDGDEEPPFSVEALRRPRALAEGATLGIAAPAFAVDARCVEEGAAWLRSAGFRVKYDEGVFERCGYLAGDDARRARELQALLEDPEVDAVLCARGGYGCQRILPFLDAELFRRARKPLLGYSDVTVLHLWQLRHAGLTGFHAPMLEHGGWSAPETEAVRAALAGAAGEVVLAGEGRAPGRAEGRLVGGSLKLVATSLGTPFEIDSDGAILLLEDVAEKPYAIDRMLQQLLAAGKLERALGVGFGQLTGCVDPKRAEPTAEQVIEEILAPTGLPLVLGLPFGHGRPNLPWPVGVRGAIDGGRGEVVVLEAGVER